MNLVEPIRSTKNIHKVKQILAKKTNRDLLLFILGINTGLRISDILKLKVSDVKNKKYIVIKEQKTNKIRKIVLTYKIRVLINKYTQTKHNEEFLFKSRRGINKPIGRIQAWRIIKKACLIANINEHIGTHTMRKTFGYHFYKKTKDIVLIQNILNHSNPVVTLRYIGITQDNIDKELENFFL